MEDFEYGMEMEWKKIPCMEYEKIVFHSIPCPGSECHQTCDQDFAKRGEPKVNFIYTKTA